MVTIALKTVTTTSLMTLIMKQIRMYDIIFPSVIWHKSHIELITFVTVSREFKPCASITATPSKKNKSIRVGHSVKTDALIPEIRTHGGVK